MSGSYMHPATAVFYMQTPYQPAHDSNYRRAVHL